MLIEFKRPQLEDREVISEYFWNYPSRSCDRTFVNGFLWSRFYNGGFAVIEDTLVFEDELNGKYSYSSKRQFCAWKSIAEKRELLLRFMQ